MAKKRHDANTKKSARVWWVANESVCYYRPNTKLQHTSFIEQLHLSSFNGYTQINRHFSSLWSKQYTNTICPVVWFCCLCCEFFFFFCRRMVEKFITTVYYCSRKRCAWTVYRIQKSFESKPYNTWISKRQRIIDTQTHHRRIHLHTIVHSVFQHKIQRRLHKNPAYTDTTNNNNNNIKKHDRIKKKQSFGNDRES